MDRTKDGLIIIENELDGEVIGNAVALGENSLRVFREAEIDTSIRPLDYDETVAAVHGLFRMNRGFRDMTGLTELKIMHEGGRKAERAFRYLGGYAEEYLTQLALPVVAIDEAQL
jgi:hypothetical protein